MSITLASFSQATTGTVSFTIKTLDNNKHFSPAHVLAIWVENNEGNFIKTLEIQAARRMQYLYTWKSKSAGNKVDAISGPTLPDHISHTVIWNCKDTLGNVVKDGPYKIFTEFTSEHAQGPLQTVNFTKGKGSIKLNPENQPFFIDMNLVYTPGNSTGKASSSSQVNDLNIIRSANNNNLSLEVNLPAAQQIEIGLYNQKGQLVKNVFKGKCIPGKNTVPMNLSLSNKVTHGKYVIILHNNNFIATRNVVI